MDGSGETESEKNQQDFHLYLRLVTLLNDYGGAALRQIFRRRYENLVHIKWEDGSQTSKDFHKTVGKSVFKSAKLIQRAMLQKGDLNEWDLALLSLVLQNIDYTNGSAEEKEQHENENKAIKELIKVRNSVEHLSGKSISVCDFNIFWKRVSDNLVNLDVSPEEIDYIRSCANIHGIEFKPSNANHVNAENCIKSKELKDEGNAATRNNQLNKALQLYTKALNLYGVPQVERGMIYSNRSSIYLKLLEENATSSEDEVEQNYKLAKEDAENVIELRPTWCKGYYRLGRVLQFKKEWESAIFVFDQALGLSKCDKEILNARDACRFKQKSETIKEHIQPCILQNKFGTFDLFEKFRKERGVLGNGVKRIKTMFRRMQLCVDSSDPELQSLGFVFFAHRHCHGVDGYKKNYKKAAKLFSKAAKIGNAEALFNVGQLHQHGKGVVMDFELAAKYFEKAATCPMNGFLGFNKLGVVAAQYALGRCYDDGVGKPQNFSEAAKWYSLASQNGCGQASNNLAFFYKHGSGVEKSLEKAIQYCKLAASTGEILGMKHLAYMHLHFGNLDEAERWYFDSVKAGILTATLEQKKFRQLLEQKRQRCQETKDIMNSVAASGQHKMMQLYEIITVFQKFSEEMELLYSSRCMLPGKPRKQSDSQSVVSKYWKRESEIRLKAAQGFSYAKKMLASMHYFMEGRKILHSLQGFHEGIPNEYSISPSTVLNNKIMLRAFANCYRTTEIVACLTQEDGTILKEIAVKTMSRFKNEVSEVDCDARVCYSWMISSSLEEAVNFLGVSERKYPNEVFFSSLQSNLLGFLEKYHKALEKCVDTLKRFPDNVDTVDLLQSKAKLMYFTCNFENVRKTEETANAFKTFLESAPPDHRKVPDAYYCLGLLSLELQSKDEAEAENYLKAGNEAENNLLSCFIPYVSDHKKHLHLMLDAKKAIREILQKATLAGENNKANSTSGKIQLQNTTKTENGILNFKRCRDASLSKMQQTNPMRIYLVLKYRNILKQYLKTPYNVMRKKKFSTTKPINEQKLPSQLTGLKEITLDQMNPTTDHVYSSKVLHATIMEDCIFDYYPSIPTVIKDDNGDFMLCYFYNFNQKDVVTRKKFSFGSRISILNPYHRLPADLGFGIRIDDPQSVVFHSAGDDTPICRFCCKPDPSDHCSKCKRANYCSRNCQLQDWNLLKHRRICRPYL